MSKVSVAGYIDQLIKLSGMTNAELASGLKYSNGNMVSMLRRGQAKLPKTAVKDIAELLHIDPVYLMRKVLQEYEPEVLEVLDRKGRVLTLGEEQILNLFEEAGVDLGKELDPALIGRVRQILG
jgi:transcriptional regulator with XRE-family HTH domain